MTEPLPAFELPGPLAAFDARDGLWVSDARHLRRLDLRDGRVQRSSRPLDLETTRAMAVAPDGSQVVIADQERCLQIHGPFDDEPVHADLFVTGIADVAFSPDGRWLALAHSDEGLLLVDAGSMEPRWASEFIASQQPVLRFSSDASLVAVNTCEAVIVFDVETGAQLARVEPVDEALFTWAADPDLEHLVLAIDCGARLLHGERAAADEDDETGLRFTLSPLATVEDRLLAIGRRPGSDLLYGASAGGRLYAIDATGCRPCATLGGAARRVDVASDGAVLLSQGDGGRSWLVRGADEHTSSARVGDIDAPAGD